MATSITDADTVPAEKELPTSPSRPKKLGVKEVPHKRIGHLKVDKDGGMLYKKTPSSILIMSLQLGIQQAVGSLEPKPKRDLLMTDFEVVEVTDFPSGGSEFTPAHRHKDFRFKTCSPVAFRFFREAFQIKPEDFLVSIAHNPLTELSNPGASGSLFYRSSDDEFILKTVSRKEAEFLQKLLPGYYLNLTQNKRTLLPKFFGLYNYQSGGKNIRLTVMNNLLPSSIEYHEKYDLKGSTYKRFASSEELAKSHPTYKDLDFARRHPEGITLVADVYDQLMSIVKKDVMVLKSFDIMDYSLLLGIHNIDEMLRAGQDGDQFSPMHSAVDGPSLDSPLARSITYRRVYSIIPENASSQLPRFAIDDTRLPYQVPPGGVLGKNDKGDRVLIFLGVIDILQSYRLRKKLEHTFKSVFTDGDSVSVHKPGFYMRRFYDFVSTGVFKREAKVKSKTRRSVNGRPAGMMRRQTSMGSEEVSNIRVLPRQRSLTTPDGADPLKRQSSPPIMLTSYADEPLPQYSEAVQRPSSRSSDHLPKVEESHEESEQTPVAVTTSSNAALAAAHSISLDVDISGVGVAMVPSHGGDEDASLKRPDTMATGPSNPDTTGTANVETNSKSDKTSQGQPNYKREKESASAVSSVTTSPKDHATSSSKTSETVTMEMLSPEGSTVDMKEIEIRLTTSKTNV